MRTTNTAETLSGSWQALGFSLGKSQAILRQREAQQPCSNLPEAVLLQVLKLHGFDTLGKIWSIFSPTAASPSSLGYVYWILQATGFEPKSMLIHHSQILSLQGTSLPPTGNTFSLQEPLKKSVFSTMIVQTLLIKVNYTHSFYLKTQVG